MNITFVPLAVSHFPLLLKWLEAPHVKAWWDQDINWTPEIIRQKYESYTRSYKVLKLEDRRIQKPIHAFVIALDDHPIGYIQYYNKHDFPSHHGYDSSDLPRSCAGFDWYIGESEFTGRGIGSQVLSMFIQEHVFPKFQYVFVDPESNNSIAIRAYKKAGFARVKEVNNVVWMMLKANSLL